MRASAEGLSSVDCKVKQKYQNKHHRNTDFNHVHIQMKDKFVPEADNITPCAAGVGVSRGADRR